MHISKLESGCQDLNVDPNSKGCNSQAYIETAMRVRDAIVLLTFHSAPLVSRASKSCPLLESRRFHGNTVGLKEPEAWRL